MAEFAQVLIRATDQTKGAFDSASRNMRGLQADASKLNGLLGSIGVGVSVAGLAAFAKSGIDAADALNDMSQRLGVSVKDLASFKLAAEQSGTSLDGVGSGIARLTRSIGEAEGGNKKLAGALGELGISARDPKEAFFQLADAVQRIEDPSKRAALLSQVLGKSYQDLVPLLSQGGTELRKSAAASESFAEAMARLAPDADKFNDQLAEMKINAAGISANVLGQLLPAFSEWVGATDTLIERHGVLLGLLSSIGAAALPGVTAGQLSGSVSSQAFSGELKKAKDELATIQAAQKSGTFGVIQLALYGSREGMERQRAYLEGQIATLESSLAQFRQRQEAANKGAGGAAGDSTAQLSCIAAGGTWDGKRCIKKPPKSSSGKGPDVASIISDENARNAKLIADEVERIAGDYSFMAGVDIAQNPAALSQEWAEAGRALTEQFMSPLEKAEIELARIQELLSRNLISPEVAVAARESIEVGLMAPLKKTDDVAHELGLTFTSAFEDAIVAGGDFSDILKGIEQDLARLIIRKSVTEPMMSAFDSVDFGSIFSSFTASANGNVFANAPGLSAYSGSVVSRPTVFPFASGIGLMGEAGAEAILPLKRGADGKLGVAGGGGSVQVNVINNANGTQATASQREEGGMQIIDVVVEQVEAKMSRNAASGRGIAPTLEQRYGLNPVAGSYR